MVSQNDPVEHDRVPGHRGATARRHAQQVRRFYTLTAASTVVPGLGLLRTRRRVAQVMVGAFALGLLVLLGVVITRGLASSVISVGVSRSNLTAAIPVIVLVALVWVWGIVTTARDNLPERVNGRPKLAMLVFTAFAAVLVIAPAAQAVRYAAIQHQLIGNVFESLRPEGAVGPGEGADPWAGTERVNVMLVGSDAGASRIGTRPDSIMVASIDPQSGETVLFGIPRNLQDIPFSEDNPLTELYPDG